MDSYSHKHFFRGHLAFSNHVASAASSVGVASYICDKLILHAQGIHTVTITSQISCQFPGTTRVLPVRGVVGRYIDRCIR